MPERFLPGVPGSQIEAILNAAPVNEIAKGNFDSPESSAALAANAFGFFLNRPEDLPLLPGCDWAYWPALSLTLEKTVRFPWRGERHPVLDVLVVTSSAVIGIESKRFEPYRKKTGADWSPAYWRPVWGDHMKGYEKVRDRLHANKGFYARLDAAQLVKHAFALRTQAGPGKEYAGLMPILLYLYAEPEFWPRDRTPLDDESKAAHRQEIEAFAGDVSGDEVKFLAGSYRELLEGWSCQPSQKIRDHAEAVIRRFSP